MNAFIALLRRLAPFTTAALVIVLAYVAWGLIARRLDQRRAEARFAKPPASAAIYDQYTGSDLKILQFYGAPASIVDGETAVLCYGVLNAAKLEIEPAVGPVQPSINRCVSIDPAETTRYTLTASDAAGKTVSSSVELAVRPNPETVPKVLYFLKGRKQKDAGRTLYTLCFETRNATLVSVEPRAFAPGPLLRGCFYVAPERTTTYKLTATDARGRKAERSVIAEVP